MDWFPLVEQLVTHEFTKQLFLVALTIGGIRRYLKKIELKLDGIDHSLTPEGTFGKEKRQQNKKIDNIMGVQEAHTYQIYVLESDVKQLKQGVR